LIDPVDLEQVLDRELKQLRRPQAPRTLLPRVMAAAGRAPAPWYRRPWIAWPAVWQVASVILIAGFAGGLAFVPVPSRLVDIGRTLSGAAALIRVVSQVFLQPIAMYVLVLAISLSVACAALWSALNRFAFGEASHQ